MPTGGRADFAVHAALLFLRQDYDNRELVILDDGNDGLKRRLPQDRRITYKRTHAGQSIGDKRCSAQLEPLLAGRAEITALRTALCYELRQQRFWTVTDDLHRRLFLEDVHGGTLAFTRRVRESLAQYPDASLAEDAGFLKRALGRGARLERIAGDGHFIYVRHATNAWQFPVGTFLDPRGWRQAAPHPFGADDRAFYERCLNGTRDSDGAIR
jgi:O-antigen biosynthesis protein